MSCAGRGYCAERKHISDISRKGENAFLSSDISILASRQPRKIVFSVAIIISLLCSTRISQFADAWASMQFQLPNGQHVYRNGKHWPSIGHEIHDYKNRMATAGGGSQLNAFGKMMKVEGMHWTQMTCNADADGDGYTNGEELGDPDCIWTKGQVPTRTTDISHPGYKDSFPTSFKSKSQIAAEAVQKEFDEVEAHMERRASETNQIMDQLLKRKKGEQQKSVVGSVVLSSSFGVKEVSEEDFVEKEQHNDDENDGRNVKEGLLPPPPSLDCDGLLDLHHQDGNSMHDGGCPSVSKTDMMYDAEQFKFLENEYIESRLRTIEREVRRRNGEVFEPEEIIVAREEAEMQKRIADFQLNLSKKRFEASEREREETIKRMRMMPEGEDSGGNFDDRISPRAESNIIVEDPLYSSLEMPSSETISKLLSKANRATANSKTAKNINNDENRVVAEDRKYKHMYREIDTMTSTNDEATGTVLTTVSIDENGELHEIEIDLATLHHQIDGDKCALEKRDLF